MEIRATPGMCGIERNEMAEIERERIGDGFAQGR